jgi:hypothetical protein
MKPGTVMRLSGHCPFGRTAGGLPAVAVTAVSRLPNLTCGAKADHL